MDNQQNKIDFLEKKFDRLMNWIQSAESKLNLVITLSTAMLGVLAILASTFSDWTCWSLIPTILTTIILLMGLIFTSLATFPRTKGPKESLIYFNRISEVEMTEYKSNVIDLTPEKYIEDLIKQCHRNAQIVSEKYMWVKRSMICLFVSFVPWLISLYVLY